jgi:hypothetical protein
LFFIFLNNTSLTANEPDIPKKYVTNKVLVYAIEKCSFCLQEKEEWEFQQKYISSLENHLQSNTFNVTYLLSYEDYQDLNEIYEYLDVPQSMQISEITIVIDEKAVFIDYVPIEIITDFLENYTALYKRFILQKDDIQPFQYEIVFGESSEIHRCRIEHSLESCMKEITNPNKVLFRLSSIELLILVGLILLVSGILVQYLRKRSHRL